MGAETRGVPRLRWKSLSRSNIFWALVALAALLLFNLIFTPGFMHIEIREGHFYGHLIDILKNGAPIMLLAIGMTLVIATHGIDISVGSVVAMSAPVWRASMSSARSSGPASILTSLHLACPADDHPSSSARAGRQ